MDADALNKDHMMLWYGIAMVFLILALTEHLMYIRRKGSMPGPRIVPPFIGKLWASLHPKFEGYIDQWKLGDVSCSSVLHKFIIFATSNESARTVLNSPKDFTPAGVASMRTILQPDNWVFLSGKEHLEYRTQLAPFFRRDALVTYLPALEHVYAEHTDKWRYSHREPQPIQFAARELNMATALHTFCGARYIPHGAEKEMSEAFMTMTFAMQLVNIPLAVPGTEVYKAVNARNKIMTFLSDCVTQAREYKGQPESLLERWLAKGVGTLNTRQIAMTLMSFIFASQDASTSSIVWAIQILADRPDVLAKVREEQMRVRPRLEPIRDLSVLDNMRYTFCVVKELLRYRPPVLMMPYETLKDTTLQGHHVAKGTFVIPSMYPSLHDPAVYSNPEHFDPDRDFARSPQHYLVWGHGPHMCIGREYAMMHLAAFISHLSVKCDWHHVHTSDSAAISIFATTYPKDGCIVSFSPREA